MTNHNTSRPRGFRTRILAAALAAAAAISLLPALTPAARADSWSDPYLNKLVSWGVMRGDLSGNLNPDGIVTRAEFVTLINRAFGYDQTGTVPFSDVNPTDWYYDDISIGYNTGYFNGTAANTAAPHNSVTREQAAVLISRNLMLDSQSGETTDFTDSRSISTWSRGLIASAVSEGILHGYTDGSFRPTESITRGQMAIMLVNAIGTPVSTSGDHTLGGVYGNVTVSADAVTLRDTTITGNLYITGGLGKGYVNLENVTVLGKIVTCGAGESNAGNNSVLLRNVTAPELIVNSLAGQYVTIRADGDTKIDSTSVRTPSYLEDATDDNGGFSSVRVEGDAGIQLDVAGNLKEITTLTPKSTVNVNRGSVMTLNVDEAAVGATVRVASGAAVDTLNLDVGAAVTGTGDVRTLNVNTAGASAAMVPDLVSVRPGLTASIGGTSMDTVAAAESSADPRLLSGYPTITELTPTSASAGMRTNKAGTIYWAVTSITDGSAGEEALLSPASASVILKSGSVKAAASNTDYTAKLSGLTSDGSYYFSAMLVDAKGQHSPVKVAAFTTPDNTTPNFAAGYPYLSKITNVSAQVTVMPTKTCRLYYALLPKGSTAPAAKDFRASAVPGNLGFGSMDVVKNTIANPFYVNSKNLTELASYDLYLWLTDADGAHSSAVKKLSFTTVDGTPPTFVSGPTVNSIKETSVGTTATLDEAGTIYWAAVKEGEEYPKPTNGQTTAPELTSQAAKLQVVNGIGALKSGKATAAANKELSISIAGLTSETAYDLYYVAQDKAGNYSASVGKMTIHTLDTNPPAITQEFTRTNDAAGKSPLADTDIRIVFSEGVQDSSTNQQLLALYQKSVDTTLTKEGRDDAAAVLTGLLRDDIQLYSADVTPAARVKERSEDGVTDWVIDYRHAAVTAEDGKIVVTFKAGAALNLKSGAKYYFKIQNIADTSTNKNIIRPNPSTLATFTTVFAQIQLSTTDTSGTISNVAGTPTVDFDMSFRAVPVSTGNAGDGVCWDLLFRMNIPARFELYEKIGSGGEWRLLKDTSDAPIIAEINSTDGTMYGASYTRNFRTGNTSSSTNAEALKDVTETRYYGIRFTSIQNVGGEDGRKTWSGKVEMQVLAIAGSSLSALHNLAVSSIQDSSLTEAVSDGLVQVGSPTSYTMKHTFSDTMIPEFVTGYPHIVPSDLSGTIHLQLTRTTGKIFYVIAPVGTIATTLTEALGGKTALTSGNWNDLPTTTSAGGSSALSSVPSSGNIMTPPYTDTSIIKGSTSYYGSNVAISLKGLSPETKYVAYFVLQGSSSTVYSANPYLFGFETSEISRPIIELTISNPSVSIQVDTTSDVDYMLAVNGSEPGNLRKEMVGYAAGENKAPFQEGGTYYQKGTGQNNAYTVLDAMSDSYFENGKLAGSVFDHYATQEAKDSFAEFIRSQTTTSGNVKMSGTAKGIPANTLKVIDCSSAMVSTTWYTFLAVGKSSSDSGDAFRAIRPLFNTDEDAPQITACNFVSTTKISSVDDVCNGSLTLVFNEDLYWVNKSGVNQEIIPLSTAATAAPSGSFAAGLAFTPGLGSGITYQEGTQTGVISTVGFRFKNARPGSTITALKNIGDQSGNVHTASLSVTLSKYVLNANGTYDPVFTITPSEWDGR